MKQPDFDSMQAASKAVPDILNDPAFTEFS
jgi:hypothetical protein